MKRILFASLLAGVGAASVVHSASLSNYLIVGQYVNDTTVDASSFELGRVANLSNGGPAVSPPGVSPTVSNTPTYDAEVAIIETSGEVKFSNMNLFATSGVDCAGTYNACTDSGSNFSNTNYNGSAISSSNGVNSNVDMTGIISEITTVRNWVAGLSTTASIVTTSGDINSDTIVNLSSGLNVLDFSGTGGNDITVKADLIFQGGANAYAVVLVNSGANFKTSNGNLVIGNGGIGLNNVVIISRNDGTDGNFDLSNTTINGVALWDLGLDTQNNMSLDNVSGCTQLVGDDVDIQNVRLNRCAFNTSVVPVPAAAWLFVSGLGLLGWMRRSPTA